MSRLGGIDGRARDDPGGIALVDDEGTRTWAQVADEVDAVGGELLARAPGTGDRVAVVGENRAATLVTHAAGILAGVGTVAVSRQLTAAEMAEQFRDAGVVTVVTGPVGLGAAVTAAREAGIATVVVHGSAAVPRGATPWSSWTTSGRRLPPATDRPAQPPLVYTSGTTGKPRGTPVRWASSTVSSAAEYAQLLAARSGFPAGPHLVVGPLQHNGPLTAVRHLLSGQPVVVLARFDAERVLQLVERHRVRSSVMVPTHFSRLLDLPAEVRNRYDVSSLQAVAHTGSACPADVKRAMIDWFGPVLVESYGGSEIGTVCRISSEEWLAHPGSVGRAVEPFEVVALDESGAELGPGEVGVLGFRTPAGREIAYHGDPEKSRAAYVAPGVATLGDVGYVTADGFVHITDRVADMVVSGGVNLYPAESEEVLRQHPQVVDVAAIGVPDRDLGEALHALVVAGDPAPDPDQLGQWCRQRLASYKCPRSYEFVEHLPRTIMGKLDKRALRSPYWEGRRTIAG